MKAVFYFEIHGRRTLDEILESLTDAVKAKIDHSSGGLTINQEPYMTRGAIVLGDINPSDVPDLQGLLQESIGAVVCEVERVGELGPGSVLVDRPEFYLALAEAD